MCIGLRVLRIPKHTHTHARISIRKDTDYRLALLAPSGEGGNEGLEKKRWEKKHTYAALTQGVENVEGGGEVGGWI
jgi:hypothetical protein